MSIKPAFACLLLSALTAHAAVERVEVHLREPVLNGRAFGEIGSYEKLSGEIVFAVDPANERNRRIVDLSLAQRAESEKSEGRAASSGEKSEGRGASSGEKSEGRGASSGEKSEDRGASSGESSEGRVASSGAPVKARANFMVLRPAQTSKGNGVALVEVSNRGGKALLPYFNRARFAPDPTAADDFGDALLLRLGYTLVWVGWQADVPDDPQLLRLSVPTAREFVDARNSVATDKPITGLVRADWVVDQPQRVLPLAHRNHRPYAVYDVDDAANVLTERDGREAQRRIVPRASWRFTDALGKLRTESNALTHILLEGGFKPGKIYELVYRARDPLVIGLGFAAIRDIASYAKYDKDALFPAQHAIAFGVSQTGRFLRHFLYQNFNTDEQDRAVYDGMFIHAAGAGRGSFNHRFAQPSRDGHRYNTFFFPTDLFPFSGATQRDAQTDATDGLLAHVNHLPKVFYTNSGYEYWGRAASLIHTTPDGSKDVEPLPNERIYHLASGQHFVIGLPLEAQSEGVYHGNALDYLVNLRALLPRLTAWVKEGKAPPASRYPRIDDGTLVPVKKLKFPAIPGMPAPQVAHTAYRVDYGPRWREGIVDYEPPKLGPAFVTLVPQVDEFGNELGGIRNVELRVPLGTYAPWNLRAGLTNRGELTDFFGTFAPLPQDEIARKRFSDSRRAITRLYANPAIHLQQVEAATREVQVEGFLLPEDAQRVLARNAQLWEWLFTR